MSEAKHECGRCTMCCKLLEVDELSKPANSWCAKCSIGHGCTVHGKNDFPTQCAAFECLWLQFGHLPDELRPDKCSVVLGATVDGQKIVAYVPKDRPDAFRNGAMSRYLKHMSANGIEIIVVCGNKRTLIKPLPAHGRVQIVGANKNAA